MTAEHGSLSFAHVRSGDVLLMNRKCLSMKDPLGTALCCLTKTENRFDHVGMFLKIREDELHKYPEARKRVASVSPSGTYVLETNMRGVTLYEAERRVGHTTANEVASRCLNVGDMEKQDTLQKAFLEQLESLYNTPYKSNVFHLLPSIFSPPDKMDRVRAAHKFNALRLEVAALTAMANMHPFEAEVYRVVAHKYRNAQSFLLSTYFPHLPSTSLTDALAVNWSTGHYWVDGVNNADKMVCSELICNLWHRVGLTVGYAPASSMRPFDFLDNERFNFVSSSTQFGEMIPLKVSRPYARYWKTPSKNAPATSRHAKAAQPAMTEDQRLQFLNDVFTSSGLPPVPSLRVAAASSEPLPSRWVVQSSTRSDVIPNLWFRVFSSDILFAACAVPCAPLTMRWMEGQAGLFLSRGSVWSLSCGLFARNVSFAAVQALVLAAAARRCSVSGDELVMGSRTCSSLVDTRHPYYATVALYGLSALAAHFATTPLLNVNIFYHFGPVLPGPISMRRLCRGSLLLTPAAVLLPFQASWLTWYETAGSFIVPTLSSVWRPREDLLTLPEWPHYRNDALIGAFAATLLTDALLYPLATLATRRFMGDLYKPQRPPSFGRSLYAGYRYRLLSNLFVLTTSTSYLYGLGSI
ncbi:hypothetical protein GH5_01319 [Leishmania sp. Ghana 2012 LV757]|uniref:hypothetical protein n=1 Tax=Leishmania sp. Ghana 2012 LV757 TaxID=2803181 RepID=UPI001B776FA8|nr:hypothetical protein GH5_01319 [Leishmania sp. Ghana 2012 LV757]